MSNVWTVALISPCKGPQSSRTGLFAAVNGVLKASTTRNGFPVRTFCSACLGLRSSTLQSPRQARRGGRVDKTISASIRSFTSSSIWSGRTPKPIAKSFIDSSKSTKPFPPKPQLRTGKSSTLQIEELTSRQIRDIFGRNITRDIGRAALVELQDRRLTGSLADRGVTLPKTEFSSVTETQAFRALEWLREQYPLDEENRAAAWAEREATRIEEKYLSRAQKLRIYKKDAEHEGGWKNQGPEDIQEVDDGSVLVQRQRAAKKEREERERREKEEEEQQEKWDELRPINAGETGKAAATGKAVGKAKKSAHKEKGKMVMPWNNAELREGNRERHKKWDKLAKEAELRTEDIFANRSAFSRLFLPTLFGLTLIGLSLAFAAMYTPPRREARMWPDTPPSVSTCVMLALLNGLVFVAWRYPRAWYSMNRYFMLSAGHPNVFSVLGNLFSHQQSWHLVQNMAFLFALGPAVHEDIGRGNFLALYLSSGVLGALFNLYVNVIGRKFTMASVGASGALFGILGAWLTLRDEHTFKVPFTDIKVLFDSKVGIAIWAVMEFIGWRMKGPYDHLSHLGGMVAGCIGGVWLRTRGSAEKKEAKVEEQGHNGALMEGEVWSDEAK